jgi:Ca2+-binding RTX toxin-like protein
MAWFTFTDASDETLVFRLNDPALVAHAGALLAGDETSDPRIGGTVVKTPVAYNIGWSYHLDPASVFFFEMSTEVGDSTMRYIEDHLDEVGGELLPGSIWTGWSSTLVDKLAAQTGGVGSDALVGSDDADILFGRAGDDQLRGAQGDDHLVAAAGNDRASGGYGDDKLGGGAGDDTLSGGQGGDILVGDTGDDWLTGGGGPDRFVFHPGMGDDRVADFTDMGGIQDDVIDLRAYGFTRIGQIGKVASGDDLILTFDGDTARLVDYLADHTANQINDDILI